MFFSGLIGSLASGSMTAVWLVLMVVLLIIEGAVPGFALGAFAAMISAILRAPLWLQIIWFFVVSIVSLVLTRPLVKKYVNSKAQPTNADMVIGKECRVTEDIDNIAGTGAVSVGGKIWTARTESDEVKASVGELMTAVRIEGVKLIVKPAEK